MGQSPKKCIWWLQTTPKKTAGQMHLTLEPARSKGSPPKS